MRIVLIAAEGEPGGDAAGLERVAGVELRRVHPDEILRHRDRERLEGADGVLLAVPAPLEESLLPRVRDLAPGAVRIVVRGAGDMDPGDALARGAEEIVIAETLQSGLAAAEIRRAVESVRVRRGWRTGIPLGDGEEAELFRVIFNNDVMAVSLNELTGPYVAVNDVWVEETGYGREEVIGRTPADLGVWGDPAQLRMVMAELRERGRVLLDEMRLRTRHGAEKICRVKLGLVEFRGRPHVVGFSRDVTEERRLARELLQAQKMEAVGRLAAGAAHDFNNLLAVIRMAIFLARSRGTEGALLDCIEEIEQTSRRGATLVRQLLGFARHEIVTPRVVDLDEVVRDVGNLIRRVFGESIDIVTRLDSGDARVFVDPGQIEQILMNLAINARDAMPAGGSLTLETSQAEPGAGTAEAVPPGRFVRLTVRDTGSGMSEEVRARIFDPFFTTKSVGEGTGLGLVSVKRIVSESGGRVVVESEPGQGAAFHVFLPRHEEKSAAAEARQEADPTGECERKGADRRP